MEQYRLVPVGNITIDRVVRDEETILLTPGGIANLCGVWAHLVETKNITPVSNIGNDEHAGIIKDSLSKLGVDTAYITEVEGESRLYEMNVDNPSKPIITRKQNADKVMGTYSGGIHPIILKEAAFLFYHSFATVFEAPYIDETVKTMKEAHQKGIPVVLDCNIRQQSLGELETKKNCMQEVFGSLDLLKVNEGEAKAIVSNGSIDGRIEEIALNESELGNIAYEIKAMYNIETVAITLGDRGSFISAGDGELRVRSVKPGNFVNSLGAGDWWDAGWCMGYLKKLSLEETAFLASALGSLATEEISGYPQKLTKEKIRESINRNSGLFAVDPGQLLEKLGF